jgi:hypothetical protein
VVNIRWEGIISFKGGSKVVGHAGVHYGDNLPEFHFSEVLSAGPFDGVAITR